jgi:uncharacterized protein (DUF58 family)
MDEPHAGRYRTALAAVNEAVWASSRRSPLLRRLVYAVKRVRRRRRRRSGTHFCIEGWYYLLVLAFVLTAAMLREMNLMLILVGMLVGPLLFSWRLVIATLSGLDVRRRMPSGICAGDLLVVNVGLSNPRRKLGSWAVAVREQIRAEAGPGRGQAIRPQLFFLYVPAGRSRDAVYRGRLPERGRYRFGPLRISTRFPFGLFERRITWDQTDTLIVFPRLGRLTHAWITRHHEAFEGSQRRERRSSRIPGEFYGVREWRNGDSRRWIHWRRSARLGTLVVREFAQQRNRDVAVLVDLWQPDSPKPEHGENVELAVSFAATVVADLCRKGASNVLLGTTGAEPECIAGPASPAFQQGAMEQLAVAEASPEDRLPALLEHALRRIGPGVEVVLVSPRANDLGDASRFPMLSMDPARRAIARRMRNVNTATKELAEYFQAE